MVTEAKNIAPVSREQNWRLDVKHGEAHRAIQIARELMHRVIPDFARGPLRITKYSDKPFTVVEMDSILEGQGQGQGRGRGRINQGLVLEGLLFWYNDRLTAVTRYSSLGPRAIDEEKAKAAKLRGVIEVVSEYVDPATLNRIVVRNPGYRAFISEIAGYSPSRGLN